MYNILKSNLRFLPGLASSRVLRSTDLHISALRNCLVLIPALMAALHILLNDRRRRSDNRHISADTGREEVKTGNRKSFSCFLKKTLPTSLFLCISARLRVSVLERQLKNKQSYTYAFHPAPEAAQQTEIHSAVVASTS